MLFQQSTQVVPSSFSPSPLCLSLRLPPLAFSLLCPLLPLPPSLPPSLLTALYSAMSEETVCPSSIIWFSEPPLKRGWRREGGEGGREGG